MRADKDIEMIFVDKNTSQDQIKEIRKLHNNHNNIVHIIISTDDNFNDNLKEFVKASLI